MKICTHILGTLLMGLTASQVSAAILINDPTGLTTAINSNTETIDEEVGNIDLASFNLLGERVALTFEVGDGFAQDGSSGTGNLDRVELLEIEGSPLDLRVNFGSNTGFRVLSGFRPTGGATTLVYQGTTSTATIDFIDPLSPSNAQPVTGVAFTANRLEGAMIVSLYSDLARTSQIGSDFTILANTGGGGSEHSFFGYYDGGASIASVSINSSSVGQFAIDDLNISTIPEPSTLVMLLVGACVMLPAYYSRRKKKA